MASEIRPSVAKALPSSVRNALGWMPFERQVVFEKECARQRRRPF